VADVIIDARFSEATLVALADRYQQMSDGNTKRPPALPA